MHACCCSGRRCSALERGGHRAPQAGMERSPSRADASVDRFAPRCSSPERSRAGGRWNADRVVSEDLRREYGVRDQSKRASIATKATRELITQIVIKATQELIG